MRLVWFAIQLKTKKEIVEATIAKEEDKLVEVPKPIYQPETYSKADLVPYLVKIAQDYKAKIDDLETRLQALEAK